MEAVTEGYTSDVSGPGLPGYPGGLLGKTDASYPGLPRFRPNVIGPPSPGVRVTDGTRMSFGGGPTPSNVSPMFHLLFSYGTYLSFGLPGSARRLCSRRPYVAILRRARLISHPAGLPFFRTDSRGQDIRLCVCK